MKNSLLNRQRKISNRQLAIGNKQLTKCKSIMTRFILPIAFCLFFSFQTVNAQTPITLQQAIDTALQNNLTLKNEKLRSEYQQKLIATGKTIPATQFFTEYGQINSVYPDVKIGISQSISFPKVYTTQKNLMHEEWKNSVLQVGVQEAVLKKQVTQVYYTLIYLQKKKNILQKTDSLFKDFLEKALLRFQKGESNILEKTTAENQHGQIALQLTQLEKDAELAQLQFQLLLNTTTVFIPFVSEMKQIIIKAEGNSLDNHPVLLFWKQQQNVANAMLKLEKSKLLPDLNFGYNLMGMKGVNVNNQEYNSTPRFQSVQIGLGIPIFTQGQKAKINVAKINERIAANEFELQVKNFETAFHTIWTQYQKHLQAVDYFKNTALINAETITLTAKQQFMSGEINYLEWVILTNQSIAIQSDYLDALKNLNAAIAELNYYLNN